MKKYKILLASLAVFISLHAHAQEEESAMLQTLTFEECNTQSFFERVRNGTMVAQYVAADGSVLNIGDTLVLGTPGGSRATSTGSVVGGVINGHVGVGVSTAGRTNIRSQYATIIMGKPAGFGNVMNALAGEQASFASADRQGEVVVIAEMRVRHDGGRKKPLELMVLLGEPNGRAFGINKYMSTSDYEASVTQGEIRTLNAPPTRDEAIAKLKESKDLFDLELLSEEEYNKIKDELSPIILGK